MQSEFRLTHTHTSVTYQIQVLHANITPQEAVRKMATASRQHLNIYFPGDGKWKAITVREILGRDNFFIGYPLPEVIESDTEESDEIETITLPDYFEPPQDKFGRCVIDQRKYYCISESRRFQLDYPQVFGVMHWEKDNVPSCCSFNDVRIPIIADPECKLEPSHLRDGGGNFHFGHRQKPTV